MEKKINIFSDIRFDSVSANRDVDIFNVKVIIFLFPKLSTETTRLH